MPLPARQRPYLAAYCVILNGDDLLVMLRQNTGYADGQWAVPAGHVDVGESVTAAATRELAEETGLCVETADWRLGCAMHRWTPERECMDMFMIAERFSGNVENREPAKCGALEFHPLSQLPTPFLAYHATAIRASLASDLKAPVYLEDGWNLVNG